MELGTVEQAFISTLMRLRHKALSEFEVSLVQSSRKAESRCLTVRAYLRKRGRKGEGREKRERDHT